MKPIILSFFLMLLMLSACRKPTDAPALSSVIKQGTWYVNQMKDNGVSYTSAYNGWKFSFKTDSTLIVSNGVDSCSGKWKEDIDKQKFLLNIQSANFAFIWISQEWDIILKTPGRVIFRDNKLSPTMELQLTKY
jgi:hypothetical protein